VEPKCFKNMEALEATNKNHNISIESSSYNYSSHGHTLSSSGFSFNATFTYSSYEWLIDSRESYHMAKYKSIFYSLNECNNKQFFFGDDISLNYRV
jgi:hypothetical protein